MLKMGWEGRRFGTLSAEHPWGTLCGCSRAGSQCTGRKPLIHLFTGIYFLSGLLCGGLCAGSGHVVSAFKKLPETWVLIGGFVPLGPRDLRQGPPFQGFRLPIPSQGTGRALGRLPGSRTEPSSQTGCLMFGAASASLIITSLPFRGS